MDELAPVAHFFQSRGLQFWDVFAVLVLFGFLIAAFMLALREHRMREKAKQLVRRRYTPPPGKGSRRLHPRLLVRIPARVMVEKSRNVIEAEVLDVSAGGIRLLLFQAPRALQIGEHIDLMARDPLFLEMDQPARAYIVRTRPGPRADTPTIHGEWQGLAPEMRRKLSREIRQRLLHDM